MTGPGRSQDGELDDRADGGLLEAEALQQHEAAQAARAAAAD